MSWHATAEIKRLRKGITQSEKLVLMMLADYANEKTGQCNPSVKDISDDCVMSVRQVQRLLTGLEKRVLLQIDNRRGGRGKPQYWLLCIGYTPDKLSGVSAVANVTPPPTPVSPHPRHSYVTPGVTFGESEQIPNLNLTEKEQRKEPQDPEGPAANGRKVAARAHPLNFTDEEWRYFVATYRDQNPQRAWHEWIEWVEEGGERRIPKNKSAAFEGWLKKRVKGSAGAAKR